MTRPSLLFVCTPNAGRSARGAARPRQQAGNRATLLPAGVAPAEAASDGTTASLAETGTCSGVPSLRPCPARLVAGGVDCSGLEVSVPSAAFF
jgi:hypothetical protein